MCIFYVPLRTPAHVQHAYVQVTVEIVLAALSAHTVEVAFKSRGTRGALRLEHVRVFLLRACFTLVENAIPVHRAASSRVHFINSLRFNQADGLGPRMVPPPGCAGPTDVLLDIISSAAFTAAINTKFFPGARAPVTQGTALAVLAGSR